jgi:hypothetical protein
MRAEGYNNDKSGLQQFQKESCQPIKRLKEKEKKKKKKKRKKKKNMMMKKMKKMMMMKKKKIFHKSLNLSLLEN